LDEVNAPLRTKWKLYVSIKVLASAQLHSG
jgi:hypothetical protein